MNKQWLKLVSGVLFGMMVSVLAMAAGINTFTKDGITYIADSSAEFPTEGFDEICSTVEDDSIVGYATWISEDVVDITACLPMIDCTAEVNLGKGSLLIPCLEVKVNDEYYACNVEMKQRGNSMNWEVDFVECEEKDTPADENKSEGSSIEEEEEGNKDKGDNKKGKGHGHGNKNK